MINEVRNTVQSILNKNNYGYLSSLDFNLFAKNAQMEVFLKFFMDYDMLINEQNKRLSGTDYADRLKIIEENIASFIDVKNLSPIGDGEYSVPSLLTTGTTMLRLDRLLCYDVTQVGPPIVRTFKGEASKVTQSRFTMLTNSNLTTPDEMFPIYTITGQRVVVSPSTFNLLGEVEATYVRYPADPKWTYVTILGGDPVFDQSQPDYQDFEVGLDEFNSLVAKILSQAGVSIREGEVVQYAEK